MSKAPPVRVPGQPEYAGRNPVVKCSCYEALIFPEFPLFSNRFFQNIRLLNFDIGESVAFFFLQHRIHLEPSYRPNRLKMPAKPAAPAKVDPKAKGGKPDPKVMG